MLVALVLVLGACDSCDCGASKHPSDSGVGPMSDGGMDAGYVADGGQTGAPIGSACMQSSDCGGPGTPECLLGIHPLMDPTINPVLGAIGLEFNGGYCSFQPNCTDDSQCDPANGGRCFRPFHATTLADWETLQQALCAEGYPDCAQRVIDYGVCLKTCTSNTDCRTPGYRCELPMQPLFTLLSSVAPDVGDKVDSTQTFCVPPGVCAIHGDCGVGFCDSADGMTATCTCPSGFVDDGTTCAPVCSPACGSNQHCTVDSAHGDAHVCVCDDGLVWDGTQCIQAACVGACDPNADFVLTGPGVPRCVCGAGYVGDGASCTAIACAPTCDSSATCTADADARTASCECSGNRLEDSSGACPAAPATRYVATTGSDTGDCSASSSPCLTINYAVTKASAGDVIQVASGTYAEMVVVDKSLVFRGANAGVSAGVSPGSRGPESVVIGFRSPGYPHPTAAYAFSATIDGFTITPQGDHSALAWNTYHLVSLYGGPMVRVVNNVFDGGDWDPTCSLATSGNDPSQPDRTLFTCQKFADSAVMVQSGTFEMSGNLFDTFHRPVDLGVWANTNTMVGRFAGNVLKHMETRGIWVLKRAGGHIDVVGNVFDASDYDALTTGGGVAGIVLTAGDNAFRGNTFEKLSSGVFVQVCDSNYEPIVGDNVFEANRFHANRSGIQYFDVGSAAGCTVVPAQIHGNDFVASIRFGVRWNKAGASFSGTNGDPPATLDATHNYWGDAAGANVVPYSWMPGDTDPDPSADNVTPFVAIDTPYTTPGGCLP
ncbi:MAG: right-handed parallel beta-helix repeat-containing protein [Polyangiales bacterium]